MNFNQLHSQEERLEMMGKLSSTFFSRAKEIDETGSFPFDNINDLVESGYTSLTIPAKFGGKGINLLDLIQLQEKIAEGDGATSLSIGWHLGIIKNLGEKNVWEESVYRQLCAAVQKGSLINSAQTEPQTGSPTRGGKPQTTAKKKGNQWVINGQKSFTTMAPVLDYFIVSAGIQGSDEVGNFLISRTKAGVTIKETWDSIAMRGTGSHDLVLSNVVLESHEFVEKLPSKKKANGWLLHIPACYLGIAQAAQKEAIRFAKSYSPNTITGTIINHSNVQQKIGEMEYELVKSRHLLYAIARKWDEVNEEDKESMIAELGAVKMAVTNSAIQIVDTAMRLTGARSLSRKSPLQRYYRDIRAGLHNPPMDDLTIQLLSRTAIEREIEE